MRNARQDPRRLVSYNSPHRHHISHHSPLTLSKYNIARTIPPTIDLQKPLHIRFRSLRPLKDTSRQINHNYPIQMANTSVNIPHRCIAVLKIIQELLDKLGENRGLCGICKNKFEPANVLAIFGCCGEFCHLDCASGWLNSPLRRRSLNTNTPPQSVTCMLCTARWHPRTFNGFFPLPKQIQKQIEQMAGARNVNYIFHRSPTQGQLIGICCHISWSSRCRSDSGGN